MGFAKLPLGSRSLPSGKGAGSHWEVTRAVAASAAASKKAPIRALLSLIVVTQISWLRCRRVAGLTLPRCSRLVMTEALGSRPAPGTPSAKRPVGTRRAASMQDTLSEGTARAAQLAPSAATAGAVGGPATRGVVGRVSPKTSGSSRSTRDYTALEAAARLRRDSANHTSGGRSSDCTGGGR